MAQFPKLNVFVGQKLIFRHYYIQNFKDGIQIQVCKVNEETVSGNDKKIVAQAKCWLSYYKNVYVGLICDTFKKI